MYSTCFMYFIYYTVHTAIQDFTVRFPTLPVLIYEDYFLINGDIPNDSRPLLVRVSGRFHLDNFTIITALTH